MDNFEPIDINFVINSPQVKADAAIVREEITGTTVTVEKVTEKASRKVKEEFEKATDAVEEFSKENKRASDEMNVGLDKNLTKLVTLETEINSLTIAEKALSRQFSTGKISQEEYTKSAVNLKDQLLRAKLEMKAITTEIGKQGQPISQQKAQWNGLGNSINQISREIPAFTYSAQTGFMAMSNNIPILVDEINRLRVTNATAAASGAATIPVWKAVGAAIFSWGTAISLIITLFTVFGKEIGGWITGLFKTSDALDQVKRSQEAMNEAFKSSDLENAISDLSDLRTNLDLAKKGLIDQKTVIEQYNETIGQASKEVKNLAEVEQGLIDNADNYVKASLFKAAADAAREKVAKEMLELAEKQLKAEDDLIKAQEKYDNAQANPNTLGAGQMSSDGRSMAKMQLDQAKKELDETAKAVTDLNNQGTKLIQSLKQQSLDTGLDLFSDESEYNKITENIKKVNEQYANAGLERAEKEIQTVKDKYAKLRTEAEKFNSDPKNKANLIDVSGLDAAEQNAIAAIQEKNQKDQGTKKTSQHRTLLDKIAEIDAEYARKSFSKDEEELQALRDKFGKVRQLVERFNADPKNKAQRIDLAGFDGVQTKAEGELKFRQETAVLAKEITAQKALFKDFEDYKLKFGTDKAKEQYGEQIGEYESYLDYLKYLKAQADEESDVASSMGLGGGAQSERLALIQKEAEDEVILLDRKNQAIEMKYQSHAESMKVRLQNYLRERKELEKTKTSEELAQMDQVFDQGTQKLEAAEYKKTEAYKQVMRDVRRLTIKQSRETLSLAEIELEQHKDNAEERIDLENQIASLKEKINQGTLESIFQITSALGNLGVELSKLGDSSSGIAQLGSLMSGLASGVNDLMTVMDKELLNADGSLSPQQIAAGINGIVKLVGMLAGAAKARKTAEEAYYQSVIGFQNQYNLSLNEQIRLQSILSESVFLTDYEGRIKDGLSALKDANAQYQESLALLSGGQAKTGQKNAIDWGNVGQGAAAGAAAGAVIGTVVPLIGNAVGLVVGGLIGGLAGLFGGKKKKDTFVPLLEEYNDLIQIGEDGVSRLNRELAETLVANNLVDEGTKQLIEDVIAWEDSIEKAREQVTGVVKDLVGQLGGDVRNALVQAFRDGEDAALALGATVEKVLEDMVSQIIFNKIFADQFQQLQDEMVASQDVGGDGNWIDDFERFFEASKGLGEDFNQAMKDAQASAAASGFNILQPTGSDTKKQGIQGGIERITEETGLELAGLFRGFYDISKRNFDVTVQRFALEQRLYENSAESFRYTVMIERNTAQTVVEMQSAVVELKTIARNTKSEDFGRDKGFGDI